MSANEKHPNGLANGSDQVGRNYMFHNSQAVVALSLEPNLTHFQKTISLNDFYFRDKDFDFPLGNIQMIGKSKGPMFRADAPFFTPGFVLNEMARHAVDFWLTTEDIPDPNNRVTLDREKKIILNYTFNNQVPTKRLFDKLKSLLKLLESITISCRIRPIWEKKSPSPAWAINPAPAASELMPQLLFWMSIAKPMKWTISMSWTPVSFPALAR